MPLRVNNSSFSNDKLKFVGVINDSNKPIILLYLPTYHEYVIEVSVIILPIDKIVT